MQDASSTRLSVRVPIEQLIPVAEQARENGFTLFTFVAQKIGAKLNLNGMSFDMPESCEHMRVTLKLPIKDALSLHSVARKAELSAANWVVRLVQENTPPRVERDLNPIGQRIGSNGKKLTPNALT
jgi:hypothetical protein